jgi:carbon-monoxide dehydrogenase medium subunit
MKLRLAQPEHLIDIGKVPGLSYIREEPGTIAIGALTTYTKIAQSDLLHQHFPILPEGASEVGDQQVRNRGTIGGSAAHADPAGDLPAIILALKAEMVVRGANGFRTITADDFFIGMYTTALEPNEILTELRFAIPSTYGASPQATGSAYLKLPNKASHYAITGCAAVISHDGTGTCTAASIVITGASVQPTRVTAAEAALVGKQLNASTITEAAQHVVDGLEIVSDMHGSEEYRRQMTIVIARRTLLRALERA